MTGREAAMTHTPAGRVPAPYVAFDRLHELVGRLSAGLDLRATLDAVARAVVDVLGFEVAVVNLVVEGGDLDVVAVAGHESAREALLGQRGPRAEWDALMAVAERWGLLRFIDHTAGVDVGMVSWTPDVAVTHEPDAWHRDDQLFAPLLSLDGGLIGVLSVDVPRDGRQPGPAQRSLLELFAIQAAGAIENAHLHAAALRREWESAALATRLATLVGSAPVAIVEFDADGAVTLWNPAAEDVFGWGADEVLGRRDPTIPREIADEQAFIQARLLSGESIQRFETIRQRKDGSRIPVEVSTSLLYDNDGEVTGGVGVVVDITERRTLEDRLRHAAFHDALTGLANRALFDDRITAAFDRMRRAGGALAVLMLDLDGFKQINDTLGHAVGDDLLVGFADRLRTEVRAADTVARYGGDEFVVLVEFDSVGQAEALCGRILAALDEPLPTRSGPLLVGASIGVARTTSAAATADQLLRQADIAMYAAKADELPSYRVFDDPPHSAPVG
jgi:diguanylate cyclase (GGDEF)-like protein/PAS domain S-box-containing protein